MRTALRGKRDACGSGHEYEAGILVTGVIECIEPALNERVIKRADGNESLAVDRVGKPERGKQDEQVHLCNAELDVLAFGREIPVEGRRDSLALENVGHVLVCEQAAPIDPWPEIGRDR